MALESTPNARVAFRGSSTPQNLASREEGPQIDVFTYFRALV